MCLLKADVDIDVVSFIHFHNKHSTLLKAHTHTHIELHENDFSLSTSI